jgi:hypothetical protein
VAAVPGALSLTPLRIIIIKNKRNLWGGEMFKWGKEELDLKSSPY